MAKRKKKSPKTAIYALVVAYILWGINTPLIKLGLEGVPVPIFMTIKILLAALLILPFAIKTWQPISLKTFARIVTSALVWISIGNLAFYAGLERAPSINGAVIFLLAPLILFVFSIEFLKERFSIKVLVGLVIAAIGSMVIVWQPFLGGSGGPSVNTGNALFMIAVFAHVVGTIMVKPELKKVSAYQAAFIHLFFGVIPIAIYAATKLDEWSVSDINQNTKIALFYGVIAITLANYLLMFGLKRKRTQEVGIFAYIQPVTAIITAAVLLAEYPDEGFLIGAALVFVGIYLAEAKLPSRIHIHYQHHHH